MIEVGARGGALVGAEGVNLPPVSTPAPPHTPGPPADAGILHAIKPCYKREIIAHNGWINILSAKS